MIERYFYNLIMKMLLSFLILFLNIAYASEFGEYRYSQYLGLQQQLQNQRMMAIKKQRMYNQSPTRNIRYPSRNNPYPNIQRAQTYPALNSRQRYSAQYYSRYYN